MKKFSFFVFLGVFLVVSLLFTTSASGQDDIPTVTLPISNLLEVREGLIRAEGKAFPGGWSKYYLDYKGKTGHYFEGENANPFDWVEAYPFTLEMWWVQTLMLQGQNLESGKWAEKEYADHIYPHCSTKLVFQIFLNSDSLNLLAKENLRFVYQDSTGSREDGTIYSYNLDETKKPIYSVMVMADVPISTNNPQDITWFSLHILNKYIAGRVDMRWDFRKD